MPLRPVFSLLARKAFAGLAAIALAGASSVVPAQPAAAPAKDTSASMTAAAAAPADPFRDRLNKSPRHQEWVDVKAGDRTLKVFVVYPEVSDKAPAVLMIHEIFGASDWAMAEADEIAEAGFIAVLPDLLSGKGPKGGGTTDFADRTAVTRAVSGLQVDEVMADLNAVADYIKTIPSYSGKLVSAGFCWGGGQSFNFAVARPDLAAACVFYGTAPRNADDLKKIQSPVYGFYGGNDNRITSTVEKTTADMKAAGKPYEPVVYEGAGHGFMRQGETDPADSPNRKARDEGFKRLIEILKKLK